MFNWDSSYLNKWIEIALHLVKGNEFYSGIVRGKKKDLYQVYLISDDEMTGKNQTVRNCNQNFLLKCNGILPRIL